MMTRKTLLRAVLILPLALFGVLGWALLWPDGTCSDPRCARKRFELFVEMDAFRGIDPIPLELETEQDAISARSILLSGGIDVTIEADDNTLPYQPESGPLDRADLYQYSLAWRNRAAPSRADAQIYAVLTPALISDRGERLFGIMFDSAGREGVAIAPQQTARTFQHEPDAIPLLQLRTFMHEMLHALNRRHLDASQSDDGRLTLEAPTRCITQRIGTDWSLTERPLMALSPATIGFFQTAAPRDVLPGGANTPFDGFASSANECADARANLARANTSRWELAKQRLLELFGLFGIQSAAAQEDVVDNPVHANELLLLIQAQEAAYPLGYPLAIRVIVQNRSEQATPLRGRLAPPYGLVQIEYRFSDEEQWRTFKPLMWYEPADDEAAMLEPGGYAEQTAAIYFGDDGWTFPQPGEYEVRATAKHSEGSEHTVSNTIRISVAAPQSDEERASLEPLLDENGMLDADVGRLLTFGGRITDEDAYEAIEEAVEQHASTALGSALRLTLGSQRLSPPIDPLTGEREKPSFANAEHLLEDTCTDSGVAALKHEFLQRFRDELPTGMQDRLQSSAEAWDGVTAAGEIVPTYSDPGLQVFGESVHFCWNDASLKGETRSGAARIARELKRIDPKRIILVGHADYEGACRFNDTLALRRAGAVKQMLLRAGVASSSIKTVSLGERRPLDFASTETARQLNRRVEVLYEPSRTEDVEEGEAQAQEESSDVKIKRVLPQCAARR